MKVDRIDHLVLTVQDVDVTCDFYSQVLGMQIVTFGNAKKALSFGDNKINLHQHEHEFEPKAAHPTPGSGDLCLITSIPISDVLTHLKKSHVTVIEGPVRRTGAVGAITSVYFRDPDSNLIEVSTYDEV